MNVSLFNCETLGKSQNILVLFLKNEDEEYNFIRQYSTQYLTAETVEV